jgi:hypothetical protein
MEATRDTLDIPKTSDWDGSEEDYSTDDHSTDNEKSREDLLYYIRGTKIQCEEDQEHEFKAIQNSKVPEDAIMRYCTVRILHPALTQISFLYPLSFPGFETDRA